MTTPKPSSGSSVPEPHVLLQAVNFTVQTIERRARVYRSVAVGFSLTALGVAISAIVLQRWVVLAGWMSLPLFVLGFLFLDRRIIRGWSDRVQLMRDQRGLKLAEMEQTLAAFRYLPAGTLRSMLAMLSPEKRDD